jgi:uncharacterized membrane protein YdjX (TVP38/TMEM64 family)
MVRQVRRLEQCCARQDKRRVCGGSRLTFLARLGLMAAVVALATTPAWLPAGELIVNAEALTETIRALGGAGVLFFVAAMAGSVVIGPIPTVPFAVAAGMAYGALWGTALALSGGLLGAMAAFLIGRSVGRGLLRRRARTWAAAVSRGDQRSLFLLVLTCRLIPVVSFAVVSYGAGLTAISLRTFVLATALGMLPMTSLCAVSGSTLNLAFN